MATSDHWRWFTMANELIGRAASQLEHREYRGAIQTAREALDRLDRLPQNPSPDSVTTASGTEVTRSRVMAINIWREAESKMRRPSRASVRAKAGMPVLLSVPVHAEVGEGGIGVVQDVRRGAGHGGGDLVMVKWPRNRRLLPYRPDLLRLADHDLPLA